MPDRRTFALSVALAVVLAVAVGTASGIGFSGEPGTSSPAASGTGAGEVSGPGTADDGGSEGDAAADATADEGATSGSESMPSPSAGAQRPGSRPARVGGVLVMPESPGPAGSYELPGLEQGPTSRPMPSWQRLPDEAVAARGRLVAGYPARLLAAAPRSRIVSSSVAPSGSRVQVALVARRGQAPAQVLRFYRLRLAGAGFGEEDVAAVGGAQAAAFRRAGNRVVVTVDPGRAETYSVYATFALGEA